MGPVGPVLARLSLAYLETVFAGMEHDGSLSVQVALIRLLILPMGPHGRGSVKRSFLLQATVYVGLVHDSLPYLL